MSERIPVSLTRNPYEILVEQGALNRIGEFLAPLKLGPRCALITDSNVNALYGKIVTEALEKAGYHVSLLVVPAGESSKCMAQAEKLCDGMINAGLDRTSFVAALGGGVVGDLAGFVAAIYYRGIPCIQIPTTVVSQVDSAIGGKTGVNATEGKNLIGAFHQPSFVLADPETLTTLPAREFNEGMAEVIKHAVIRDAGMLDALTCPATESLIARNVKIKAAIVAEDEFERHGLRALLNFGHTIGHAIENAAGYGRFLHGEAISLGLVAALNLSVKKAGLSLAESERVVNALRAFSLPTQLPSDLTTPDLMDALRKDKKFVSGSIRFVLTEKLGSAFVSKDITEDDIREAIEQLR